MWSSYFLLFHSIHYSISNWFIINGIVRLSREWTVQWANRTEQVSIALVRLAWWQNPIGTSIEWWSQSKIWLHLVELLTINLLQKLIEDRDTRNRTPLLLAATLGHFQCARILMSHNANVNVEDSYGFNGNYDILFDIWFNSILYLVLHEAVGCCDAEFISEVLERRDLQRYTSRVDGIPILLRKICDVILFIYNFISLIYSFFTFRRLTFM